MLLKPNAGKNRKERQSHANLTQTSLKECANYLRRVRKASQCELVKVAQQIAGKSPDNPQESGHCLTLVGLGPLRFLAS
jgi:hypothetical protein